MSFPKTIDELVLPFLAIQMTEEDRLGKPYRPNGEGDSFILQASASARAGPYYDLIYGNSDNNNRFGTKFSMRVRLTNGQTVTYGFHRLAESTKWIWTMVKSNCSLEMKISSTVSSPELSNCINWAFRYFYSEVFPDSLVPWYFQEGAQDSEGYPTLLNFDLMAELEKERLEKEREEQRKAEEEAQARRQAERVRQERLALQEEARRIAREHQEKAERIAREAREAREHQARLDAEAQQKEATEKAFKAKLAGAKEWFLRTVKSSQIKPDGLLKAQLEKLSVKDIKLFTEFLDDEQIGSDLIKQWWVEYCSQPQINF